MAAPQAFGVQSADDGTVTRHVELSVLVRAAHWVRARRFVASEISRRGLFLLTTDAAAVGTTLVVEIPAAGRQGISAHVTVRACQGGAVTAGGHRPPGWCVTFDDLGDRAWHELEAWLDEQELRDSLPVAKPGPAAAPVRSDFADPEGSMSPSRLFADLPGADPAPALGAAELDPLEFGRPGAARTRAR